MGSLVARLTFERLATALLFLMIAVTACLMPAQSDTWWHLRQGEVLWHGGAPLTDYFSHTVPGAYWENREWLSQLLFFLFYKSGGLPALTLLAASAIVVTWHLVWRTMDGPLSLRLALTGLGIVSSSIQWSLRPQIFTLLFMATTLLLLARRIRWPLPLLFLAWANLHGGVLAGIALLVTSVGWSIVSLSRREAFEAFCISAAAVAATALTPLGTSLWTHTPGAIRRMHDAGILEFRAAAITNPSLLPFWMATAALVVLALCSRPWREGSPARRFPVVSALAFTPLGVMAERNTALVMLLMVPALHHLIVATWPKVETDQRRERRERPTFNAAVLTVAALAGVLVVARAWTPERNELGWSPLPAGLAATIESCRPPMYNTFEDGGYLIWFARGQKVFIDNRFDPYPTELVNEDLTVERTGTYRDLFDRFGVNCAAVRQESVLAERLRDAGWHLRYQRQGWAVLERPFILQTARRDPPSVPQSISQ